MEKTIKIRLLFRGETPITEKWAVVPRAGEDILWDGKPYYVKSVRHDFDNDQINVYIEKPL